jgi:pilus assembly protein FimV
MSRASFAPRKFLNTRAVPGAALRALALGVAVIGMHPAATAIGVGRPQTLSALGQPLHLVFPVSLGVGESLSPDCVTAEVLAGDVRVPATGVVVQLEGESELKVRAVRLRSVPQIDEPLVTVSLSLGCPARLVRQYTAFIDPPGATPSLTTQAQPAVVVRSYSPQMQAALNTAEARPSALLAPAPLSPGEVPNLVPAEPAASSVAPVVTRKGAELKPASAAVDAGTPSSTSRTDSASAEAKPAPKGKPAQRLAAAQQGEQPAKKVPSTRPAARLQLEPAEAMQSAAPAAMPAASETASSAAGVQAGPDAAAERMAKLEQGMLAMQAEQRLSQQQLQALRAELERAQSERYLNPLTVLLAALTLGLSAVSFQLWRSRKQERQLRESAWWADVKSETVSEDQVAPPRAVATRATQATAADLAVAPTSISADSSVDAAPATPSGAVLAMLPPTPPEPEDEPVTFQLVEPVAPIASAATSTLKADTEPVRVNVEDLIDLEQQVDFFLVLGQDDAAIELLRARLDGAAAEVALPYLKLLHLFQRARREDDFMALSQRYRDRFDLPAPEWSADMMAGEGLEDHAAVLLMLQRRWPDSAASMALLQSLLVGHAEDGSLPGPLPQESLDLLTQADLLMLYGVARDKSEHEVRGEGIDLFLPLEVPGKLGSTELMATMIWQAPAGALTAPNALEVDISLDEPDEVPTRPSSFDTRA